MSQHQRNTGVSHGLIQDRVQPIVTVAVWTGFGGPFLEDRRLGQVGKGLCDSSANPNTMGLRVGGDHRK